MNTNPLLHQVRRLLAGREAGPTDRELLGSYLERRDEAAFTRLVERHGPMVLGVCRSVLPRHQDAEDAFQAAFLALARNAGSIRQLDSLAGWLHRVARRLALRARTAAVRRQRVEARAAPPAPSSNDPSWADVRAVLHAEIAALPEHFREPLVLCYLEGLTLDEAARRLGQTATVIKGRLQRGREQLRGQLERRGLALSALGAAALAGQLGGAPVPGALFTQTIRVAFCPTAEGRNAAALAESLFRPLVPTKAIIAAMLAAAIVVASGALALQQTPEGPKSDAPTTAKTDNPRSAPLTDFHGDPLPAGAVARLGTVRFNHGNELNALHFTPDGKTIVSEGDDAVCLWDAKSGRELGRFATGKTSFDNQTALSADGKTLITLNQFWQNDILRVWDLAQRKEVHTLKLGGQRTRIAYNRFNALAPDGKLCAYHIEQKIQVFDVATGAELWSIPQGDPEFGAVVFAHDRLVTTDEKGHVEVWEARTGKPVRAFDNEAPAEVLAASGDGQLLAVLENYRGTSFDILDRFPDNDVVQVWDLASGTRKCQLEARPKHGLLKMCFSPDGKLLFASSASKEGSELTVWDVENGQRLHEIPGLVGWPIAVSRDSGRLAAATGLGKFELWDGQNFRRLSSDDGGLARSAAIHFSPDHDRVSVLGFGSLSTWDTTIGQCLRSFELTPFPFVNPDRLISPDGRLAVTYAGGVAHVQILVWDVTTGQRLHTIPLPAGDIQLACAFSPDSSILAAAIPGKQPMVRLWDVRTGKEVNSFAQALGGRPELSLPVRMTALSFTPDGKTLVVANKRTTGYDVASGKELFSWRMPGLADDSNDHGWSTFAVCPNGEVAACLLAGQDPVADCIALCDLRTGKIRHRWGGPAKSYRSRGFPERELNPLPRWSESRKWQEELRFSRDGRLLASSEAGVVHVWEVATGKEIRSVRGHRGHIATLAFNADGHLLATGATDSTVLIWDLAQPTGPKSTAPSATELTAWWADLAGDDAARAYASACRLTEAPAAAVPFLRQHLTPITQADRQEIGQNIENLDSSTFAVREKAFRRLQELGLAAAPHLRLALEKGVSPEARRRIEALLDAATKGPVTGEPLRSTRALAVLEHANTPEARQRLRELADGIPEAWLTRQAKAAIGRLGNQ